MEFDLKNFRTRYQSLAMVLVLENKRSSTSTAERPIVDDAKKVEPLKVGNSIPALTLKNSQDEKVSLSSLHADGPVVIMFFRSSWCPFCTRHTQELIKAMPKIKELGAQLVAISPDNVESSIGNVEKNAIPFPVLSDSNVAAARAFGLAFKVDDTTIALQRIRHRSQQSLGT